MTPRPISVSIDVPRPRADVYDHLDVMANHEPFTNHMLTDWEYSGPPRGIGSKARVKSSFGALSDHADIEVVSATAPATIVERNVSAKGARVATGTYTLDELPGGGTRVTFTAGRPSPIAAGAVAAAARQREGNGAPARAAGQRSSTSVIRPHAGNGDV
jgi:hypothetical protein